MGSMTPAPQDLAPPPWRFLQERLAGYFAARARGLLAADLVLSNRDGEEFGRLRVDGPGGARLEAGDVRATIERGAGSRYRMFNGKVILEETARSGDNPQIRYGDRLYDVRLGLLRNVAVANSPGDKEVARVAGGLTNRSYEAFFDVGEEGALPVAVFLLYRIVALRRRAFLAGGSGASSA